MTKEEFFKRTCLEAIKVLKPCYWDDPSYNNKGANLVVDFATKLTDLVFENM